MRRRRSRGFCQEACEVEARAGRKPAELAPTLGRAHPLRSCLAQPGPTSLAALTVVVTRPDLETISWWASIWERMGLWHPRVWGVDALEGVLLFPRGG
jgi:hypothetical protein